MLVNESKQHGGGVFTSRFELRTFSLRVVSFVRYVFEDMAYFDTFLYFFSRIMYSTRARPLPLSNAEWQPRYWAEKLADLGATFMKREIEKVKGDQKNVADMREEEKANNRRLTKSRVRRHRKKRLEEKLAAQADVAEDEDWSTVNGSTSDDADDETDDGTGLKSTTQKRKRVEKAVSKLNQQVKKHEEQIKNLKAQKRKYQRSCKKMEKKGSSDITVRTSSSTVTSPSQGTTVQINRPWSPVLPPVPVVVPLEAMQAEQGITAQTPRSKPIKLIRDSSLTSMKVPAGIKKKLIYANVVEDELQTAAKKSDQHKEVLTEPLTPSPDVFVKSYQTEEAVKGLVDKVTATEVTVQQKVLDARDDKRRVKVVSTRYTQLTQLKENLPANRIIIKMDFAENFTCAYTDAVQSAYLNQATVTLHPCVVYYKVGEQLKHTSYVYVSPLNYHNSSMVITILKALMKKDLQALISEKGIQMVHYITDRPFSQYHNRLMSDAVANHKEFFGIEARWKYFESGHGKGPCDGIVGSVKRMAEQAGKHGTPMADADDFFKWASETGGAVNYTWIGQEEYDLSQKEVNMLQAQIAAVKGTGMLHAVMSGSDAPHGLWRAT